MQALAQERKHKIERARMVILQFLIGLTAVVGVFILVATDVLAKESVIEEIHATQLEKLLQKKDFVAVFWYARHCRLCDDALEDLEGIDDDAEKFSVDFVKVNDKRLAKSYGVRRFPALTFFRNGEITIFEGDVTDEDEVLDFLTSENLLVIPDKIEEVNADALASIIRDQKYVSALFYDDSRKTDEILEELENIDDEADVFKIRFVKIKDRELAEEFSLKDLPSLVYFRNSIPVVYHGDLTDETEVLEWLIQHQTSVWEKDVVESVTDQELDIMIKNVDHLLVLFHDKKKTSQQALEALENIDDDADRLGVSFVEVSDVNVGRHHGVYSYPTLVYFENEIPAVYDKTLTDHDQALNWLVQRVEGADIERVKAEMLEKIITKEDQVAVLFYKDQDQESNEILEALEDIDDDLDEKNIRFVKNCEAQVAEDYGIELVPSLVVFRRGIPSMFEGDLLEEDDVLTWVMDEISGDNRVEVVTDAMLDKLIKKRKHVAVFFYDKKSSNSQMALQALEQIDDDIKNHPDMHMVKLDDTDEALEYGLTDLPTLLFFDEGVPGIFRGDIRESSAILDWLNHAVLEDNIGEVNSVMLEKLIHDMNQILVYVYFAADAHDLKLLKDLENIDHDLESFDVHLVRLPDDGSFAHAYQVDVIPTLVLFREGSPTVFQGDLGTEHKVVEWIEKIMT
eukprot:TCALIF_09219-PA protein Name:"Protein of unknown function" AED:0.40 eAED:0.40 QI:0/-1/0/1/-1/1/1/0/681